MLERVFIAMNGPVKAVLMRYQKEESYRENLHFKEYLSVYEQDVTVEAIRTRSQAEMRNMLMKTGGKVILCYEVSEPG